MIDIFSARELARMPRLYDAMLRLRHRVFKDRMGWKVPAREGFDFDEFDVCQPYYLLAMDRKEHLVGCWRMLPTTGPYMLPEVFPELLAGRPPPHSPAVWEGSRFAVDTEFEGKGGLGALHRYSAEIFCGVVEFGIALGIDEVWTVYDRRIARLLPRLGVTSNWVGSSIDIDGVPTMAGCFDAGPAMLSAIRAATGLRTSVVRRAPWNAAQTAA